MDTKHSKQKPSLTFSTPEQMECSGTWTKQFVAPLFRQLRSQATPSSQTFIIDGSALAALDSAGAWLLHKWIARLQQHDITVTLQGFNGEHEHLLQLIQSQHISLEQEQASKELLLHGIGRRVSNRFAELFDLLAFVGETFTRTLNWLKQPWRIRWRSIASGIQIAGNDAIIIVALLSFLIGVVLAYQLGVQLQLYGADIYVVDLLGIALLREFSPLITAIIIAGRTGSSYTAQIGTMKINEEIDALKTMGLSPFDVIVLPKMLALTIALPLLTVLSDIFAVFGGMLMSQIMLDITMTDFVSRFGQVVSLKMFILGIVKAPVFAAVIASIGCYQGFRVTGSADSVGTQTTRSVVQAIFMIIVVDAAFSILYSEVGL